MQTDSIRVLWAANGNADGTLYRVAVSTAPDPLSPAGAAAAGLIESDGGAEVVEPWFRSGPVFLYPMNVF